MSYRKWLAVLLFLCLTSSPACSSGAESGSEASANASVNIDGTIENGYRILALKKVGENQQFKVYRGDYVKFRLPDGHPDTDIVFPSLGEKKTASSNIKTASYIKMKVVGSYPFEAGKIHGSILVVEYAAPSYRVVTAREAESYIRENSPLILDVRTPAEYAAGHLQDAMLIPVQVLQFRLEELDKYKNKPVFVYCATGNRSTVASKILIDAGFKQITNLKKGIVDWHRKNLPVVR